MRFAYLVFSFTLTAAALGLTLVGCSTPPDFWKDAKSGQKRVLVTFPALYAITHAVAGDDVYVLSILSGQGPHGYEGAPTDVIKLNHADLLIYNGLTLDDEFVGKMMRTHRNENLKKLNLGFVVNKDHHELMVHMEHDDGHAHGHNHKHDHGAHDPHLWLGPKPAAAMAKIIAAKLAELEPSKKAKFEQRAKDFGTKMDELQAYGEKAFKDKKNKNIITIHEAFGYFAHAFDLEIVGTFQPRPGMDADAVTMSKLAKLVKEKNVRVIGVERQYSTTQAEALRNSLKRDNIEVVIVHLDPLETADVAAGSANPDPAFYLTKMRDNIDALAKALQ